ncbi:MAG: pseudouridine synthase [Eubacterium sp.]|nr:pseudouridine synthase [Eubacterium sp.]
MRINKYLSECGLCSRREADRLLEAGRIYINGKKAEAGQQVDENSLVEVDGKEVRPVEAKTYLMFYKPVGVVCTFETREKNNLANYLHYPVRITYAGRLDKNSEGLLLLTDDGDLINEMMRGKNGHEKEYAVTVNKPVTDDFLERMEAGVYLKELDVTTRPCTIRQTGEKEFRIILTQGLNRQIRRMCEAFGYRVRTLKRERVVSVLLGDLKPGDYRELTEEEVCTLKEKVAANG